ncbi:MAG: ABC transporter permease [Deltaproteobacteria bacterium]|nr:MAG: ABC transporter permease [Deltaproteobacteria bacterium]
MLLKLGLKNIGRKLGRSILTISAVALCSMGILLFLVLMNGSIDMMMKGIIDQYGHYRLVHQKVIQKKRLYSGSYFVGDAKRLVQELKKVPGVAHVAPRVEVGAYIDHKGIQAAAGGLGMDPEAEKSGMKLHKKLRKGRMFRVKGKEVVLGYRLAKRLKASVGSSVVLIGSTVDDSISALRLKVVGISQTGIAMIDQMFFFSVPSAQYFIDVPNQLSSLLVYAKNIQAGDRIQAKLEQVKRPKGVALQSWRTSSVMGKMVPIVDLYIYFLGGLIVFIAGIGLMNTMTMSVMERKGEVGIMMALGFTPTRVAGVFLTEGLVLGVIGAILGAALGSLLSIPLITTGISFDAEALKDMPFPMETTIRGTLAWGDVLVSLLIGVLSTLVGTLWPAIQASQMDPVDALRDE